MFIKPLQQRGDTIVEVLIAIAIVSLTLTGAYASVNRSANATRTAQERGEALKWAETQVEQIKASKDNLAAPTFPADFCFDEATLKPVTTIPCATTAPGVSYKATIHKESTVSGNFSVVVTWDALNTEGGITNRVELGYVK